MKTIEINYTSTLTFYDATKFAAVGEEFEQGETIYATFSELEDAILYVKNKLSSNKHLKEYLCEPFAPYVRNMETGEIIEVN